jgi:hypothetical protein
MDLKLKKISKIWAFENRIKSKKTGRGDGIFKGKMAKKAIQSVNITQ